MVRQRGAAIALPPLRRVQGMGPTPGQDAEGHWDGRKWKHQRAPSDRLPWKDGAMEAVLDSLRSTSGIFGDFEATPEDEEGEDSEGEEGGPGPSL